MGPICVKVGIRDYLHEHKGWEKRLGWLYFQHYKVSWSSDWLGAAVNVRQCSTKLKDTHEVVDLSYVDNLILYTTNEIGRWHDFGMMYDVLIRSYKTK